MGHVSARFLICSYLYRVQYCPDQFATWHDHQPLVRTRPPGAGSRSPGWLPDWLPATVAARRGLGLSSGGALAGDWLMIARPPPPILSIHWDGVAEGHHRPGEGCVGAPTTA